MDGVTHDAIAWVKRHRLMERLEHERLVVIPNFLPPDIAEHALRALKKHKTWEVVPVAGFARSSLDQLPALLGVRRLFGMLGSGLVPMFSAGKYRKGHELPEHNDKAYTNVVFADGREELHSRMYAGILYLTQDWQEKDGGIFIDVETGVKIVPVFNTLVAFKVPLLHRVSAVSIDRARYSIFGWWLCPGKTYEINELSWLGAPKPVYNWQAPFE